MATFGKTTQSSGSSYAWNDAKVCGKYTLSESGSVSKLTVDISNTETSHSACHLRAVIYDDSGGDPNALKGTGDAIAIADNIAKQWVDLTFASPVVLDAGTYWIGFIGSGSAGDTAIGISFWFTSAGTSVEDWNDDTYADGASDPWGAAHNKTAARDFDVYGTYTTGAFAGLIVTRP